MCRAVWVFVLGAHDDACATLRRAAGLEVQVIGMATDAADARAQTENLQLDAIVIDARVEGALEFAREVRARNSNVAVVWVGDDQPADAHAWSAWSGELNDTLPGVITRGLLARRS